MRRITLAGLFLLAASLACAAPKPIAPQQWMNHPEITRIRQLYHEIEEDVKQGRLKSKPMPTACADGPALQATLYEDLSGVVRKYQLSGGSDDAAAEARYYYDKTGKLRFVFQSLGAVNGTGRETRTYVDEQGAILYQDKRGTKGPGWPGGFPESIHKPREHFASLFCASGKEEMGKWNSCLETTIARYEREVGVAGLNEMVVHKCGPRPFNTFRNELRLMPEDCDLLYNQALKECLEWGPEDLSPPSQQFQMLLSPQVFQQKNFDALCRKVHQSGQLPSQPSFENTICRIIK